MSTSRYKCDVLEAGTHHLSLLVGRHLCDKMLQSSFFWFSKIGFLGSRSGGLTSCVAVSKSFVSKLPSPADGVLMPPRSNLNAAACLPDVEGCQGSSDHPKSSQNQRIR